MRLAFAIDAKDDSVLQCGRGLSAATESVPTVNFGEHRFHVRFTVLIFRVPPIERA